MTSKWLTGCVINEQVILQDQEGVLAWVSERLAVAMRQAEDRDNVLDKPTLIDLEARQGDRAQALLAAWTTKWVGPKGMR